MKERTDNSSFDASPAGKDKEICTPPSIARLLVEMIEPFHGQVFDPCCGNGDLLMQAVKALETHGGHREDVSIFGQELDSATWQIARTNLSNHGIESDLGGKPADAFHEDQHPILRADFILANPPLNTSNWGRSRLDDDPRWRFGKPPETNANFAWVQHFVHHLSPTGTAGFVLANGSMSSMQSGQGEIRRMLVETDLVDCIVACPGQLLHSTQVPVCLWVLSRRKQGGKLRDRRGQVLFLDARAMGRMETRVHRVLDDNEIAKIVDIYHAWRDTDRDYRDIPGCCQSATIEEIAPHDFDLTPHRYVVPADKEKNVTFEEGITKLADELEQQMDEAVKLDRVIRKNLEAIRR